MSPEILRKEVNAQSQMSKPDQQENYQLIVCYNKLQSNLLN